MSIVRAYKPTNSMPLKVGDTYTAANVPTGTDVVVLQMGVRLLDPNGTLTPLRGIRITIVDDVTPASSPKPKVPYIWLEGEELLFDANFTYTPLDMGVVGYGVYTA